MSRFRAFPYRGSLLRKMDGHVQEVFHEPISAKVPSAVMHGMGTCSTCRTCKNMRGVLFQAPMTIESFPHVAFEVAKLGGGSEALDGMVSADVELHRSAFCLGSRG